MRESFRASIRESLYKNLGDPFFFRESLHNIQGYFFEIILSRSLIQYPGTILLENPPGNPSENPYTRCWDSPFLLNILDNPYTVSWDNPFGESSRQSIRESLYQILGEGNARKCKELRYKDLQGNIKCMELQ